MSNKATTADRKEWIIQRCTQVWVGTELQYEDWPARQQPVIRPEMLTKLARSNEQRPDDEFRGHNVANCKFPGHGPRPQEGQ